MIESEHQIEGVICLCGNDGTGKSTLVKLISQLYPQFHVIQRSTKQSVEIFEKLRMEIKHIDLLTYRYSFQQDRQKFQPTSSIQFQNINISVYWIMLDLKPQIIFKRIAHRQQMGIYESKKCVQYYSFVYLQLAAYYGMTVVDVSRKPAQIAHAISQYIINGASTEIRSLNLKGLTLQKISFLNAEQKIINVLSQELIDKVVKVCLEEIHESPAYKQFYEPELSDLIVQQHTKKSQYKKRLASRWLIKNRKINKNEKGQLQINFNSQYKSIQLQSPCLVLSTEGESKMIFQLQSKNELVKAYFNDKIWILLKSTIYSHTNQHTGQIQNLGNIRAIGSNLFLQMLRRNNIHHAYYAINKQGIIFSRKIQTNNIQVVFKKQCVGTDKHSYFGLDNQKHIVSEDNQYKKGIYVRFDWRNPNHFITNFKHQLINLHPLYYIVEKIVGKQTFFKTILQKPTVKSMGDKCITQDLIFNYIDTKKVKKAILSLYCAFSYYCEKVGLEIIDGCCMFSRDGSIIWSQINPDCMRVKLIQNKIRTDMDKDIWRAGGSSSKEKIKEKWTLFNEMLVKYFLQNRFHETQLLSIPPLSYTMNVQANKILNNKLLKLHPQYRVIFQNIAKSTQQIKEIIGTIDISEGKPTLVKSSIFSETHSQNNLQIAFNHIKILPKIVVVDLDAAMNKESNNRQHINNLNSKRSNNIYGVGGGIRDKEVLQYYLNQLQIPKIIISTNLQLLNEIPKEIIEKRIIVQLSINEHNEILTKGRTHNTQQNVIKKMIFLSKLGVKIISITFHQKEGHLNGIPRTQFRDIMFQIPGTIEKVIIAGGISNFDDLQYIWGFPKAIPQLGSAIWKEKIKIVDIFNAILRFNSQGLVPAVISNANGILLGQVFMNRQSVGLTIQTRQLFRFSRKLNRIIKKGQQSGNIQQIDQIKIDCDNDCLNIIVQDINNNFCHFNVQSCFDNSSEKRLPDINAIQAHILMKKDNGSGYSKKMQENSSLSLNKFMEQCFQFSITRNNIVEEGADVIAHMLMYLNSKNIKFSSILQTLQNRSKITKTSQNEINMINQKPICLGILSGKYYTKIDLALLQLLGIKIIRSENKVLSIDFKIQNQQKYDKYFKDVKLNLLSIKSKDMGLMLSKKIITYCFNYSIMMENYPQIWQQHEKKLIPGLKLVILKKKGRFIDPLLWSKSKKGKIVSQYPLSMVNYLNGKGIEEQHYTLFKVSGGSEGYLQSEQFDYCDAIVQTGQTINENNLQIVQVLTENNYGCLYSLS